MLLTTTPALLLSASLSLFGFGGGGGGAVAQKAKAYEGRSYHAGQTAQCAAFVAEVVRKAGATPPPAGAALARSWLAWGRPVPLATIRPGDVVVCWRGSRSGSSGHILIYVGDGQCIHRSTQSKPVGRVPLAYYKSKILGVRRG